MNPTRDPIGILPLLKPTQIPIAFTRADSRGAL